MSSTSHTNVGEYTDSWTFAYASGNYNSLSGSVSDSIVPADATCTISDYEGTYDGNSHGVNGTCKGVGGSDLSSSLNLGDTFINVPGGTAHWTFSNSNYNPQSGDNAVVINPAEANITVNGYNGVYDGNPHGATGTATGVKAEDLSSLLHLGDTFTDVPGGTANWSFDGNGNYSEQSGSVAINISKANATCNVTGYNVTYDGASHTATGSCTGVGGTSLSTDLDLSSTTHTNSGDYSTDSWSFNDSSGNYNNINGTVQDAITRANVTCNVTGYSVTYDGNSHQASGNCTGVGGTSVSGLDLSNTVHTNAGDYSSDAWSFTDANNNYNSANGTVHSSIGKAQSSTSIKCPESVSYTGSPLEPCSAVASGPKNMNTVVTISYSSNTEVGIASASATFAGDANHTGSAATATFHIYLYLPTSTPRIVSSPTPTEQDLGIPTYQSSPNAFTNVKEDSVAGADAKDKAGSGSNGAIAGQGAAATATAAKIASAKSASLASSSQAKTSKNGGSDFAKFWASASGVLKIVGAIFLAMLIFFMTKRKKEDDEDEEKENPAS